MRADVARERRLVEARLGRPAQDALEAAVVLEAWAGVPAQRALETARLLMPWPSAPAVVSRAAPFPSPRPPGLLVEALGFLVTVLAVALWAAPLSDALGADVVAEALRLALPATLAAQGALLRRHLGRPAGVAGLSGRVGVLLAAAIAIVVAPGLAFGVSGVLAGVLTVTWLGGSILIRRGWAPVYAACVAVAVPAMVAEAGPPLAVAGAVAAIVVGAALCAVRTARADKIASLQPGRWTRVLSAALLGLGLGSVLVGDPSVSWGPGAASALALLPSAAGGLWAGQYLWRLAASFPRTVTGRPALPAPPRAGSARRDCPPTGVDSAPPADGATPLSAPPRGVDPDPFLTGATLPSRGRNAPLRILAGALARLLAVTVAGSAVLLLARAGDVQAGVLAGFAALAVAMLLVGMFDSLGRLAVAELAVAGAVAAEIAVRLAGAPFAGAALTAAGLVAIAVLLPAALILLSRPARTLATTLWIA